MVPRSTELKNINKNQMKIVWFYKKEKGKYGKQNEGVNSTI
jgi:hypothetical protein